MDTILAIRSADNYSYEQSISETTPVLVIKETMSGFMTKVSCYNNRNERVNERIVGVDGEILYETQFSYKYDSYGNITECLEDYHAFFVDFEREGDFNTCFYENEYDALENLTQVVCKDFQHNFKWRKQYYYKEGKLECTLLFLKEADTQPSKIVNYLFDERGTLQECKVCNSDLTILYYKIYSQIEKNIYLYKKLNPMRSELQWWIIDQERDSIRVQLSEPVLTIKLLSELCEFIQKNLENIVEIYLDVLSEENSQECNVTKYEEETKPFIQQFEKRYHKIITFIW